MAKLLLFQLEDIDGEYVVITEDEDSLEDHAEPGYKLTEAIEISEDVTLWPTECPLRAR